MNLTELRKDFSHWGGRSPVLQEIHIHDIVLFEGRRSGGQMFDDVRYTKKGGRTMARPRSGFPKHYAKTMADHPRLNEALEALGVVLRQEGPINKKTAHLIQLGAAATLRSEGSVHSHVRRALEAGATPEEIEHTLILLVSTIGFPSVAAALSWTRDVLNKRSRKRMTSLLAG